MKLFLLAVILFTSSYGSAVAERLSTNISIDVRQADLADVLRLLAKAAGAGLVIDNSLQHEKVTIQVRNVSFHDALRTIARSYDVGIYQSGSILVVGSLSVMNKKYGEEGANDSQTKTVTVPLRHADPDDLVKALEATLGPGTLLLADKRTRSVIITGDRITIGRGRRLISALDRGDSRSRIAATVLPLRFARSIDALKQLKDALPGGTFASDDQHNAILVAADSGVVEDARKLLLAIDVPTPQVMFEVRVVDVSGDAERRLGVLYGGLGANATGTTTYAFQNKTIPIQATLNALMVNGEAQVLATPRLATLNSREASLLIGENYPVEQQTIAGGVTSVSVTFIDIGVKLRITPTIGADGSITAEMHPEFSAIAGTDSFGNPIVTNRKIDATLRVQRDETIVLGGLLEDVQQSTTTKIPFLGDLPLLGEFFTNRARSHTKDDVVFLITPHII